MDMSKYKAMFVSESREQLAQMDLASSQLQRAPDNKQLVDQLFRQAHSIKGMAASMGYGEITDLAHSLEDLMSSFREENRTPGKEVLDILVEGIDLLSGQVEARAEDRNTPDSADLVAKIRSSLQQKAAPAAPPAPKETPAPSPVSTTGPRPASSPSAPAQGGGLCITFSLSATGPMGGLKGFLAFKRLGTLGPVEAVRPAIEDLKKGNFEGPVEVVLRGRASKDDVGKVLSAISEVASWEVRPLAAPAEAAEPPPQPKAAPKGKGDAGKVESTVRVRTSLLDYFINAVGELTALRVRLADKAQALHDEELDAIADQLEAQVRDLYAQVMTVRLMPLESVTSILPRTVRDVARKSGKEISFEMSGQDLEVDRSILEVVLDPLIHLLRNCVDHGIEAPEERAKTGKGREGNIRLSAYREREKTILQITDDGRGIDTERLRRKAISRGVLTTEAAERLSEKDAAQLIFVPGLSTAEQVTETSGRGVGMDAVKATMEKIGGELSIDSVWGQGTIFQLALPRSVAIVPVMLVGIANETFAFPLGRIARTLTLLPQEIRSSRGRRFYLGEEDTIPIVDLAEVLGVHRNGHPKGTVSPEGEPIVHVLLVEKDGALLGVEVDRFVGHQEAFIKPLARPLERISCLGGATLLGSGQPIFVIEVGALMPGLGARAGEGAA